MAGGKMHTPHPTYPGSVPRLKLWKQSKESGIFQSLGTISFVFFLLTGIVKREGGMAQCPPKYAPAKPPRTCLSD